MYNSKYYSSILKVLLVAKQNNFFFNYIILFYDKIILFCNKIFFILEHFFCYNIFFLIKESISCHPKNSGYHFHALDRYRCVNSSID